MVFVLSIGIFMFALVHAFLGLVLLTLLLLRWSINAFYVSTLWGICRMVFTLGIVTVLSFLIRGVLIRILKKWEHIMVNWVVAIRERETEMEMETELPE